MTDLADRPPAAVTNPLPAVQDLPPAPPPAHLYSEPEAPVEVPEAFAADLAMCQGAMARMPEDWQFWLVSSLAASMSETDPRHPFWGEPF